MPAFFGSFNENELKIQMVRNISSNEIVITFDIHKNSYILIYKNQYKSLLASQIFVLYLMVIISKIF